MVNKKVPLKMNRIAEAADWCWQQASPQLSLATPLGLGKPNQLLNAIYAKAKADSSLRLKIYTALSLNPPHPREDLEKKFITPFAERQWGADYPELQYALDGVANRLPKNVHVHEFYFQAGASLASPSLQQDYQSVNYTHVAHSVYRNEVQMIVQLVAKSSKNSKYSLSCNPDLTLDVVDLYRKKGKPFLMVGVVHPHLPYLGGEAEVEESFFDVIVEDPAVTHSLFALPRLPVSAEDHAIGFYASQLIKDDGTLQVGIGSLSDAVVSALLFRQKNNSEYASLVEKIWEGRQKPPQLPLETNRFEKGLYGLSEMVMDGFMYLRQAGILKREVADESTGTKTYLHGGFFLGSKLFYHWLSNLTGDDSSGLRMGRVSVVNDLYDPQELLLRAQRKHPRFLNTCMQVTLLGGAASETLENGGVVSGVGGQYNFVAMAHELTDSRSILMLRAVREKNGKRESNIVWSHGHLTIPRHLRDVVITEYGIADLRGRSDQEVIEAMIEIADSEFQPALVAVAKKNKKLRSDYEVPIWARQNFSAQVLTFVKNNQKSGIFEQFPFGSDFDAGEIRLLNALQKLKECKEGPKIPFLIFLLGAFFKNSKPYSVELQRMGLLDSKSWNTILYRQLLTAALSL
jgi:acyl-CoA hydrolase